MYTVALLRSFFPGPPGRSENGTPDPAFLFRQAPAVNPGGLLFFLPLPPKEVWARGEIYALRETCSSMREPAE